MTVSIRLEAIGDENAAGFSLTFDPAILSNPVGALGADAGSAQLVENKSQATQGLYGVLIGLPANQTLATGTREILRVTFDIASVAPPSTAVDFGDTPMAREVDDVNANPLTTTYPTNGTVTITP